MVNQYYYLISGLPDITVDDSKKLLSSKQFKEDLKAGLHQEDYDLMKVLYYKYDNQNILNSLTKKTASFNELGNFTTIEIDEEIKRIKDEGVNAGLLFPLYLQLFIDDFVNERIESHQLSPENILAERYFQFAIEQKNTFISTYFQFELHTLNFLTATYSRKYKLNYENEILGEDEISSQIRKSNARDFNISGEFELTSQLLQIAEMDDLVEREKKVEALRWNYMENAIFFNYFTIERIFAYALKLEIIERWQSISKEQGKEDFEHILNDLQTGYELPEEYQKK